jgi:hypothetical protein
MSEYEQPVRAVPFFFRSMASPKAETRALFRGF